ncbi:MAG TPA: FMN-binding negative transcriptional regulator [Acetobacteraceae bacterium]|nr:FMN-binding negative transcriptional regulator [Acetobacteraceae bacterium]
MYVPRQFREERPDVLARAARDIQFAALVTPGPEGLHVTHVPMVLKEGEDGAWTLESHVARSNPHWRITGADATSVAIFQGPQSYISPSWYATKREHGKVVPTWNYIAVHVHGVLETVEDQAWLLAHLDDLTRANEAAREHPWAVSDAPEDFVQGLTRAIVGLRLRVERCEGAWKMIQHRSEGDRLGTIAGLETAPGGRAVAEVMRELEAARPQV